MTQLLAVALGSLMMYRPALAHNGVDHNNSCFLTVGDSRVRISGYQFQSALEGKASAPYLPPVGKHFCHFFPALGQTVIAVEPLSAEQKNARVTLELAQLTSLSNSGQAFSVIKRQPEQTMGAGLVSISQDIRRRGIYRLTIALQDNSGDLRQQRLIFLVGIPVTKILVMIAGLLVLLIGFVGVKAFIKKADNGGGI